jgi:hypothetical protein
MKISRGFSWLAEVSGLWKILVKIDRHTAACSPACRTGNAL